MTSQRPEAFHSSRTTPPFQVSDLPERAAEGIEDVEDARIVHYYSGKRLEALLSNVHPACDCFLLNPVDVDRMIASFRISGPRQPIEVLGEQLLDGRTRIHAAISLGVQLPAIQLAPADLQGLSPFEYVLRANRAASCGRRLTMLQVALAAARYHADLIAAESAAAKRRQLLGQKAPADDKGEALQKAAKKLGVSENALDVACRLVGAEDKELFQLAYSGRLSMAALRRVLKASLTQRHGAISAELEKAGGRKASRQLDAPRTRRELSEDLLEELRGIQKLVRRVEAILATNEDVAFDLTNLRLELARLNRFVDRLTYHVP